MRHKPTFTARINQLRDADFERGHAAGKTLSFDEAVALAAAP